MTGVYEVLNMIEIEFDWLTGVSVGFEFPGALTEAMDWSFILDLFILRIVVVKWNRED